MVKDEEKINKEVIENLEKVQGAFFNSGQYQIIFGTGTVNKMYDEVVVLGLPTSSKDDMKAEVAKQGNWFWWKSCRWYRSWYDACLWLTSKRLGSCSRW
ncbi:putative sucrose-specific phosphotransferase system (PTS)%2C IIABC component [Streptococcus pneumoniae]|nr:putative sucrose-specific phosphotransferase system (PTS)%2C IIABC component [Streptococcus pneumoniae]